MIDAIDDANPYELTIRPLTAEAFAPYGEIIAPRAAPTVVINRGMCDRHSDLIAAEAVGDGARLGASLFRGRPYALPSILDMMERHPLGSQAFQPLNDRPFLAVVAPDEGGAPGRPEAFLTNGAQGVNYRRGVWHAVLTPLGAPQDFLVIDRVAGAGDNLEEHWFQTPYTVVERPAPRDDLAELAAAALALTSPLGDRAMLAIVGGPGSGKSTLARALTEAVNAAAPGRAAYVPMDGFHRRHADLEAAGLTRLKGAPETFRPADLSAALTLVRAGERAALPVYNRGIEDVVDDGLVVDGETLCIVEGNYLLLDLPVWRDLAPLFDAAWFLDLPRGEAERRLVRRHQIEPDAPRPLPEILRHVATVDMPNFDLVAESRARADRVLSAPA